MTFKKIKTDSPCQISIPLASFVRFSLVPTFLEKFQFKVFISFILLTFTYATLVNLSTINTVNAAADGKDTISIECSDIEDLNSCIVTPDSISIREILTTISDVNQCEVTADNTSTICPTSTGDILVCSKAGSTASCNFRGQISVECNNISGTSAECLINKPKTETVFLAIVPNTKANIEREIAQVMSDICTNDNLSANLKRDCRALIDTALSTDAADQINLQKMLDQITPSMATIAFDAAKIGGRNQIGTLNNFLSLSRLQKLREDKNKFRQFRRFNRNNRNVKFGVYSLRENDNTVDPMLGESFSQLGLFINGTFGSSKKETIDNELGFSGDNIDITSGFDYQFSSKLNFGSAFGLSKSNNSLNEDRGKLDYVSYTLLMFGNYYPTPQTFINLVLSYGGSEYEQNRTLNFTQNNILNNTSTTVDQIASANYFGSQLFTELSGGLSYSFSGISFESSLHLLYINASIDRFKETMSDPNAAGSGWAISFNQNKTNSTLLKLGTQANYAWSRSWGVLLPQMGVFWNRELSASAEEIKGSFVGDPNNTVFTLPSNESDTSYFEMRTGITALFPHGRMLFLSHQTFLAFDDYSSTSFTFGFRLEI